MVPLIPSFLKYIFIFLINQLFGLVALGLCAVPGLSLVAGS